MQGIEKGAEILMDRTGADRRGWFKAMQYYHYMCNMRVHKSKIWKILKSPDISAMLKFTLLKTLYHSNNESFPDSMERLGHFLRDSKNYGDALTCYILTDNENTISSRLVCPHQL